MVLYNIKANGKGHVLQASSPITLAKTFYSGPCDCVAEPRAAIPLRSPGTVEGLHGGRACVPAVSPYPCRRVRRVPVKQRKALSGRLRATDSERTRGGGSGTRARASLSGFLGMTGSRPAQRTVWTNPALWSATNQGNFFFSGQGPVGGAGILHGRRAVRAHFRTAARTRWAGSESGRKKVVERGEAGL